MARPDTGGPRHGYVPACKLEVTGCCARAESQAWRRGSADTGTSNRRARDQLGTDLAPASSVGGGTLTSETHRTSRCISGGRNAETTRKEQGAARRAPRLGGHVRSGDSSERVVTTAFGIARDVRGETAQLVSGTIGGWMGRLQGLARLTRGVVVRSMSSRNKSIELAEGSPLGVAQGGTGDRPWRRSDAIGRAAAVLTRTNAAPPEEIRSGLITPAPGCLPTVCEPQN